MTPNESYYKRRSPAMLIGGLLVVVGLAVAIWMLTRPDETLQLTGTTLRIRDAGSAEVNIIAGEQSDINVNWRAERDGDYNVITEENGDIFDIGIIQSCTLCQGLTLDISVPANTNVVIDGQSGDILVNGISGVIDIETSSGNINGIGLTISDVTIDTSSGNVSLEGAFNEKIAINSEGGDIAVENSAAAVVQIETQSGNQIYTGGLLDSDTNSLDAASGDVSLTLTDATGVRVDVETSSGAIANDLALGDEQREENSLSGTLGDGKALLQVRTASGNVTIGPKQ